MKLMTQETEHLTLQAFDGLMELDLTTIISLPSSHLLQITFQLQGDLDQLLLENFNASFQKKDNLWENCCFELFLGKKDHQDYVEWNFAPSSAFQTYYFSSYRVRDFHPPHLKWQTLSKLERHDQLNSLTLTALIECHKPIDKTNLIYWPTAVLQKKNLERFYFAHKHPRKAPDFHMNFLSFKEISIDL